MNPFFTIAVAAYQSEPYLEQALKSISDQTFGDFEALLYVEESTDASLEICRAAERRDSRFRAIPAEKSGSCSQTRNWCTAHAAGEYILHMDGDDWLEPNALERIRAKLRETGPVDVLAFASTIVDNEGRRMKRSNFRPGDTAETFSGLEALRRIRQKHEGFHGFAWMNAYRTDFMRKNPLEQKKGFILQDAEWLPRVLFFAERVAYLDEQLYTYRRRSNSATTEKSTRSVYHAADHFRTAMAFVTTHAMPADVRKIWSDNAMTNLCWFMFHPGSSAKIPDADRKAAMRNVLQDGIMRFIRFACRASIPKRMAILPMLLTAVGWQFPAKFFFRRLYFPIAERRQQRKVSVNSGS